MPDIFIAEPKEKDTAAPKKLPVLEDRQIPEEETSSLTERALILKNPVHLFSAFKKYPEGISFRDQEKAERILLFIRRSFITNLRWIFMGSLLIILPLLLPVFFRLFTNPLPPLSNNFYLIFCVFYYLFVATYWYLNFITWYFNISLVTDRRIIDIDFSNLVYKDVAATKLTLVQDVSFSQIGAIRTFFNYGDVLVQTAGTLDNFTFEAAPQPENVVHIVEDLIGRRR